MKKIVIPIVVGLLLTGTINAQMNPASLESENNTGRNDETNAKIVTRNERKEMRKLASTEVSTQSMMSFDADFGLTPVLQWKRVDGLDEATFMKGGKVMSAFYDDDAQLVGTTTAKTFSDLPEKAQTYINDHFADFTPAQALFFDDNEFNDTDMSLYGYQFADEDSYFVEMTKGPERIVLHVLLNGDVIFFTRLD
jgi:hypothetical protein